MSKCQPIRIRGLSNTKTKQQSWRYRSRYRSFDTGQAIKMKKESAQAIKELYLPREEFLITTKIWISNAVAMEKAKKSIDESLQNCKPDYIDLLLIHQPFGDYYGTYRAMEEAYAAVIGVSNGWIVLSICNISLRDQAFSCQSNWNPYLPTTKEAAKYWKKSKCQIESWGLLRRIDFFNTPF